MFLLSMLFFCTYVGNVGTLSEVYRAYIFFLTAHPKAELRCVRER